MQTLDVLCEVQFVIIVIYLLIL